MGKKKKLLEDIEYMNSLVEEVSNEIDSLLLEQGGLIKTGLKGLGKLATKGGIPFAGYRYYKKQKLKGKYKDVKDELALTKDASEQQKKMDELRVLAAELKLLATEKGLIGNKDAEIMGGEGKEFAMGYEEVRFSLDSPIELEIRKGDNLLSSKTFSGTDDYYILQTKKTPKGYILKLYNSDFSGNFDSVLLYISRLEKGDQRAQLQGIKGSHYTQPIEVDIDIKRFE